MARQAEFKWFCSIAMSCLLAACSGSNSKQGLPMGGAAGLGGSSVNQGTLGGAATGGSVSSSGGALSVGGTSQTSVSSGGAPAAGNTSVSGGDAGTGGSLSLGGSASLGGQQAVGGGAAGSGGSKAMGSTANAAGATTTGGSWASGGTRSNLGGTVSTGGSSATGGTSTAGGTSSQVGGTASTGGTSGKPYRGVANSPCLARTNLGVSWYYNWEQTADTPCSSPSVGGEFVPMIWGHTGSEQTASSISSAIASFVSSAEQEVLGFNEPDNSGQSNIAVATALSLWPAFSNASIRVGTPATQANTAGLSWFNTFMTTVNGNSSLQADFIAIHWYGWNAGSCDANAATLEAYIKQIEAIPGKSTHLADGVGLLER